MFSTLATCMARPMGPLKPKIKIRTKPENKLKRNSINLPAAYNMCNVCVSVELVKKIDLAVKGYRFLDAPLANKIHPM